MKRSCALALSAVTLFLASSAASYAQAVRPGQQCQPEVADPSMYGNCRLHIVRGQEVCRCAIRPQALRRMGPVDRSNLTTGSIASSRTSAVGGFFEGGTRSAGRAGASMSGSGAGAAPAAGSAAADVASGASGGRSGNGQGPGNNNGLGNGSEPADNTSTDVKGTDPSNPGGGSGNGGGRGSNGNGRS